MSDSPRASAPAAVARWSRWPAVSRWPSAPSSCWQKYACRPSLKRQNPAPAPTSEPSATRTPNARCAPRGNVPAAERGVAGRAVRHRDPALPEQAQLAPGRVDVVREHRPRSQQAVLVVRRGVVGAEQRANARDLLAVLVDVRGEEGVRYVVQQGPRRLQQRVGAREREARGDGVARPADAVPLLGQRLPLGVRAVGRGEEVLPQDAVAEHQPARDAQPHPGGLVEQRVHRAREVGAEDQGRGRTGAGEPIDEVGRDPDGVRRVGQPRLLGQRAALEPVEQGHPEPADGADLREVHVGVDEAREHQALAKVDDLVVGVVGQHDVGRAAGDDDAFSHHHRGVGLGAQVVRP